MDHTEGSALESEDEVDYAPANGSSHHMNGTGVEGLSICASAGDVEADATPTHSPILRRRPTFPEKESMGELLRQGVVEHQLGLSLNLVLLAALTWLIFPSLRQRVGSFFVLQYPAAALGRYHQGPRDLNLVAGFVVLFTGLRALCMDYLLLPLAARAGVRQKKAKVRFAEQAYLVLYYVVFWTGGVVLFACDTPSLRSSTVAGQFEELLVSVWADFPALTLSPAMKLYYLCQMAFWIQQIFVINIEERRKDHWQMFTHHIVTLALLFTSYGHRQIRPGVAILALMDSVDLIFSTAKILRYLGRQTACDIAFGLFVLTWFFARHVCYCTLLWSLYTHASNTVMLDGTYSTATGKLLSPDGGNRVLDNLLQVFLDPEAETIAWNSATQWVYLSLLGGLQMITIGWFVMICRVVVKVLQGHPADDTRSDDEDEGDEEDKDVPATMSYKFTKNDMHQVAAGADSEKRFIEVTASSEEMRYQSRQASSGGSGKRKKGGAGGISSSLNLGERKDILNRIGCLSDEQLARERELRDVKGSDGGSPRPGDVGRRK
ncbi:Sphingosine N-acyltransferase lag1 [Oleoguttula sp. CCFEE 5521]